MDCKPPLSPGEIPPKYEGVVKGMAFLVDEHTKLCEEEYGQQALLTIMEDDFLDKRAAAVVVLHAFSQYSMK